MATIPRLRGTSHVVAAVVALAGAILIVTIAPTVRAAVGVTIYGVGLVSLFAASALYHRWPGPVRFKPLLQRIDHGTIYVFIAASYTPIVLLLHGAMAWVVLTLAWVGAAAGVGLRLGRPDAPRIAMAGSYLVLGWLAIIVIPQLLGVLGVPALILLGAGGLIYSAGAVVYATQRPDPWPRTFGFHEIFHALVIAAAITQYIAIVGWALPAA
ncbi:MAG: hemolysin III family protein [Solirubrobacteraceae bacterium]